MLQTLDEFIADCKQGVKVHQAMNKVTDFTTMQLYKRWEQQYASRTRSVSWEYFFQKKKRFLHALMNYKALGI